jgi:hypothetical protein
MQEENVRVKRLVAELILDKTMLQDVLARNGDALAAPPQRHLPAWALSGERAAGGRPNDDGGIHFFLLLVDCPAARESMGPTSECIAGIAALMIRRGKNAGCMIHHFLS